MFHGRSDRIGVDINAVPIVRVCVQRASGIKVLVAFGCEYDGPIVRSFDFQGALYMKAREVFKKKHRAGLDRRCFSSGNVNVAGHKVRSFTR